MTRLTFSAGSFSGVVKAIEDDGDRAASATMDRVTQGLKNELRAQVAGAGLGARLAGTWQGRRYPIGRNSIDAAAYVWSKFPKVIDAFDRGALIRSREGFFLAIPTAAAGASGLSLEGGRERVNPGAWERRTGIRLRFVYRRGAPSLLVADDTRLRKSGIATPAILHSKGAEYVRVAGRITVVIFILVPQVRLPKKLDIEGPASAWADRVGGLLAENWK